MTEPTKVERLAQALLADRHRERQCDDRIIACFICGYRFLKGEGRFCSDRCRDWFDAGNPPVNNADNYDLTGWRIIAGPPGIEIGSDYYAGIFGRQPVTMKHSAAGFLISCVHCRKEFESKGLRACSSDCEHQYNERQKNLAVMAEAGIEPSAKRACQQCGGRIPVWRKGRRVSAAVRFCSEKCGKRYRAKDAL